MSHVEQVQSAREGCSPFGVLGPCHGGSVAPPPKKQQYADPFLQHWVAKIAVTRASRARIPHVRV
eukprot:2832659-Amphidinium_carterae.1